MSTSTAVLHPELAVRTAASRTQCRCARPLLGYRVDMLHGKRVVLSSPSRSGHVTRPPGGPPTTSPLNTAASTSNRYPIPSTSPSASEQSFPATATSAIAPARSTAFGAASRLRPPPPRESSDDHAPHRRFHHPTGCCTEYSLTRRGVRTLPVRPRRTRLHCNAFHDR